MTVALLSFPVFRRTSIGTVPSTVLVWFTPALMETFSTAGSAATSRAAACWRSWMRENALFASTCNAPCSMPVSCTGKRPLGSAHSSARVSTVAPATASITAARRRIRRSSSRA